MDKMVLADKTELVIKEGAAMTPFMTSWGRRKKRKWSFAYSPGYDC